MWTGALLQCVDCLIGAQGGQDGDSARTADGNPTEACGEASKGVLLIRCIEQPVQLRRGLKIMGSRLRRVEVRIYKACLADRAGRPAHKLSGCSEAAVGPPWPKGQCWCVHLVWLHSSLLKKFGSVGPPGPPGPPGRKVGCVTMCHHNPVSGLTLVF